MMRLYIVAVIFACSCLGELRPGLDCRRTKLGYDYKGSLATAKNGEACQPIEVGSRKKIPYYFADGVFDLDQIAGCRNAWSMSTGSIISSRPEGPGCRTASSEWEYCDIPLCEPAQLESGTYKIKVLYGCPGVPGAQVNGASSHCHRYLTRRGDQIHTDKDASEFVLTKVDGEKDVYTIQSDGDDVSVGTGHGYVVTNGGGSEFRITPYATGWKIAVVDGCPDSKLCNYELADTKDYVMGVYWDARFTVEFV